MLTETAGVSVLGWWQCRVCGERFPVPRPDELAHLHPATVHVEAFNHLEGMVRLK
jgi:hypothetical protein